MTVNSEKILRALIAVLLSTCAFLLSIWAVMTEKADVNLVINAGNTNAVAKIVQFDTYSNGVVQPTFENYVGEYGGMFGSYGVSTFSNNILSLNRLRVGDRVDFAVDFTNKGNADMQYRVVFECYDDQYGLYEGLKFNVSSNVINPKAEFVGSYVDDVPTKLVTDWFVLPQNKKTDRIYVSVELPEECSAYNGRGTRVSFAIQVIPQL